MKSIMQIPVFPLFLLLALFFADPDRVFAQYEIESNKFHEGDFLGKDEIHNWNLELKEPLNDFKVQVESLTGDVEVLLIAPTSDSIQPLLPTKGKGRATPSRGVFGKDIEAKQKVEKLPRGRYTLQIKPFKKGTNLGIYRFKIVEPALGIEAKVEEPPQAPAELPKPDVNDEILRELKAMKQELKELRKEVKAMEETAETAGLRVGELEESLKKK